MTNLLEFQQGLEKLSNTDYLVELLFNAIRNTEKIALSLQKQQLNEGRDNEDRLIGVYSKSTEDRYGPGNQPRKPKIAGQPYNFEDTGGLFDNMLLLYDDNKVSFWSKDGKTELLVDKYQNLFGLDDYNLRNYLLNSILPVLIPNIKQVLKIA